MAYRPISGTVPQYSIDSSGTSGDDYVLKFYENGTTTPLSMATDTGGGTTLSSCTLNARGEPISNSGDDTTVFIPHLDEGYKIVLYANQTDADNNTTANALFVVDNLALDFLSETSVSTYAALRALDSSTLTDGQVVTVSGSGIDGDFIVRTGAVTDDAGVLIVFTDDSNRYAERIRGKSESEPAWFGCVPSAGGAVDVTTEMQAYADWCSNNNAEFILPDDSTGGEYRISSQIVFTANIRVFGRGGRMAPILCVNCSLFKWPSAATNVVVRGIRAAQAVRHTSTPNTYVALEFPGATGSRPYWSDIKENFFDGFGVNIDIEFGWEFRIRDNHFINCGKMIVVTGSTVNNWFEGNEGTGNQTAIIIGDGNGTVEGWHINKNLTFGFSQALSMTGAAFCYVDKNIFDSISGSTGILFASTATYPTFGNKINNNYMAFSGSANEGIRLLNNTVSSGNVGSILDGNEIFPYSGASLGKGILIDGTSETLNRVINNSINASIADCDIDQSANTIVKNNNFLGAGYQGDLLTEYEGNSGTLITSEVLLKRTFGSRTEYWNTAQPSSGSYVSGDKVWKVSPGALDASSMAIMGWLRLTTGSGHVSGTDWANMYVSHVSPAV